MKKYSKNHPSQSKPSVQEEYLSADSTAINTRWTSQFIDPSWHMIAACQNILLPKINSQYQTAFASILSTKRHSKEIVEFLHHCTTIIQANFRGYKQRKYYKKFLPFYRRFRTLLTAVVQGWRVRRIMKLNNTQKKIQDIRNMHEKEETKQKRIKIRDFIYDIHNLQKKGQWLLIFQKQTKNQVHQKKVSMKNMLKQSIQRPLEEKKTRRNMLEQKQQRLNNKDTIKVQKERQIPVQKVNPFEEAPIKAKGVYEIPLQFEKCQVEVQNKVKLKKKKKNEEKIKKKKEQPEKEPTCIKQERKIENQVDEKSQMVIRLAEEEERMSLPKKTEFIRTFKKIEINPRKTSHQGSQLKVSTRNKNKKGLTLTTQRNDIENMKKSNQTFPEIEHNSELSEVIVVYNSTYHEKKMQIAEKINQIKERKKFSKPQ